MNLPEAFQLGPKRRALLKALLQEEGLSAPASSIIPRRKSLSCAPLSPAQQRLWFLYQLEPQNPLYNVFTGIRMVGVLDVEVLQRVIEAIVDRHEALRTTFSAMDGVPLQQIAPNLSLPLPLADLRQVPLSGRNSEAMRLATAEASRPFDLATGPLVRATLLRLAEEEHFLLWTMHHIVSDGWSMSVIYREIGALYDTYLKGEPSPLPELVIHYPDFAKWQQECFQSDVLDGQLAYWRKQLDGAPSLLELPTDFRRPLVQTFEGASQSILIASGLAQNLRELSRQEGATLFMTLLAAFQICLARYSGQEDIVVGSPHAGRNFVETEHLVGYFVNMLPLRTSLKGDPSFQELLGRVRESALGAYAHPYVPFEQLREPLHLAGDLRYNPLFQVMFALQNLPLDTLTLPGLTLSPVKLDLASAKVDLTLWIREHPDGLKAALAYNVDLFAQPTAARILEHFQRLLQCIVANPSQRISQLPVLGEDERRLLFVEWNNTQTDISRSDVRCVHQLFEAQVEQVPDSVAVIFEQDRLTYRELNSRANQLAHHLQGVGIGPEDLVGVALDRSLELIVGLVGVLKAGAAYLPLDPAYPVERLAYLTADARPRVLLTQSAVLKAWVGQSCTTPGEAGSTKQPSPLDSCPEPPIVLCLDTDWKVVAQASSQNPTSGVDALNRAYVIYTSGSTGRPKGVEVTHGGLANFALAASRLYGVVPGERVLQLASISFDAAAEEIFPCLTQGATLVLRTESMLDSAADFIEKCQEWGLTVLDLPTAYWQTLTAEMQALGLRLPVSTRLVIIGGESALAQNLSEWRQYAGSGVRVLNTYGPTETTVVATVHDDHQDDKPSARAEIPIGRPISNTQVYLLDSSFQPIPIGAVGELHIGGAGLARGYLNRPELTAEKFVPNPFGDRPGSCLYKTGDLARYRPDGTLEFQGRLDHQVKIRGYRVELGEIDATLGEHPAVQQAVSVLHEVLSGEKQLAAYVVLRPGEVIRADELLHFLKSKLPNYMVPQDIQLLEALPVTSSGKLDRRALPAPAWDLSPRHRSTAALRTPIEKTVAEIWTHVLGVTPVGPHDNFFELGGHSLLATRLVSRVRNKFGVEFALRSVFDKPTLQEMAETIVHMMLNV